MKVQSDGSAVYRPHPRGLESRCQREGSTFSSVLVRSGIQSVIIRVQILISRIRTILIAEVGRISYIISYMKIIHLG